MFLTFNENIIIGYEEDEVLRALLLREWLELLKPPPLSLIYELTSELFS